MQNAHSAAANIIAQQPPLLMHHNAMGFFHHQPQPLPQIVNHEKLVVVDFPNELVPKKYQFMGIIMDGPIGLPRKIAAGDHLAPVNCERAVVIENITRMHIIHQVAVAITKTIVGAVANKDSCFSFLILQVDQGFD
jgi:hypothetical protein